MNHSAKMSKILVVVKHTQGSQRFDGILCQKVAQRKHSWNDYEDDGKSAVQRTIVSNVQHKLLLINWTFQLKQKIDRPPELRIVKKIRQIEAKLRM